MGNSILEPSVINEDRPVTNEVFLVYENYLSEFKSEDEKSIARANLGVLGTEETYTRDQATAMVNQVLREALKGYFTTEEIPQLVQSIMADFSPENYVKNDGSTPFLNPQSQSSLPTKDEHLANKLYVDNAIQTHKNEKDPHKILEQVQTILGSYRMVKDSYSKAEVYSAAEINTKLSGVVLKDGTTPFSKPQIGVDPTSPSHLATMRYVLKIMGDHNSEVDPHGFRAFLKSTLGNYYTKSETYTKAQTFSRDQLLSIIQDQMADVVKSAISQYAAENGNIKELQQQWEVQFKNCIKADGSVPHNTPQAGIAAETGDEFVILSQVQTIVNEAIEQVNKTLASKTNQVTWKTSGPVRTTVGFVEDNTRLPKEMTVQQIMDAIFYDRQIGIQAPEFAEYGETVCIKLTVHGIGMLESIDLYKNGELIGTLKAEDLNLIYEEGFEEDAYYEYCDTGIFTEDTEWRAEFHYSSGQDIIDTATTRLSYPIFIGAVPYWWNAQEDITMNSLRQLAKEDPDNAGFFTYLGPEISKIRTKFDFTDIRKRSIVVVIPNDYPDLDRMVTPAQEVETEAFAKWLQPMYPNNTEVGILYKIYVFNQPLVKLNQVVKFYFGNLTDKD